MKSPYQNPSFKCRKRTTSILSFFVILLIGLLFINTQSILADENVAKSYAPILYFESQEQCHPIDAQFHIDNSKLIYFDVNAGISSIVDETPTVSQLANLSDQFYFLDNVHGSLRDSAIILSTYQELKDNYDTIVYYRIIPLATTMVLQYWFFYAYNDGDINVHEGDWEMIQVILESNTPIMVMYSQHHSGQQLNWNDVDTTATHPHVYVARGSHANYLRSFSGKIGIASDTVGDNGKILTPDEYQLVELSDQGWLSFAGRWGEMQSIEDTFLGFSGPFGPRFREEGRMWDDPLGWGESLPPLNTTLLPLEWFLYHFLTIFLLIIALSVVFLAFKLFKRFKKQGLGPRVFSFLYIDGINKHSLGNLLFFTGIVVAIIGLLLPWYSMSASISGEGYDTNGFVDFLLIDGLNGVQIAYPGSDGPIALGSLIIPFSILIAIGFVFTIFKSVGVQQSNHLGRYYIFRGISLLIPFIILITIIMSLGMIIPTMIPETMQNQDLTTMFSLLSQNPFKGSESVVFIESGVSGSVDLNWGLGIGGYLMLFAGIILFIAGGLLFSARKTFY
ncbi:MAG: Vps62-related protein [Candidatus Thermoplasmatota archaeon]|nr:Vps62-related protein [Candidatus Thermoplasmatota archaeon]